MLKKLFFLIWSNTALMLMGQSPVELFHFAQYQYSKANYELALKEFQRYLFFSNDAEPKTFQAIADCYKRIGLIDKAVEYYDKTFFSATSDSMRLIALFNKSECQIQLKEFGLALVDLLSYSDSIKEEAKQKLLFMCGVCYFGMEDFVMAENSFVQALGANNETQIQQVHQIFKIRKYFYSPNPKTAYILSAFLPGLGQFYSSDFKNGMNSLFLSTFLAGVGIRIAIQQSVIDAVITIFPWFQRYYQGGIIRAESIAIEKRKKHRAVAFSKIIEVIASSKE